MRAECSLAGLTRDGDKNNLPGVAAHSMIIEFWLRARPCCAARFARGAGLLSLHNPVVQAARALAGRYITMRASADSTRIQADPYGLCGELAEEFTRKMSANKNLPYTRVPCGKNSAVDVLPLQK